MAQRELLTIGDLTSRLGPATRSRARRRAALGIEGLGATNPNFQPLDQQDVDAMPPSDALSNAAVALLAWIGANGTPSEHAYNAQVAAFQQAYNDEYGATYGTLDVDGGYGPNTQAALNSIGTGAAPAINPAPAPGNLPVPVTPSPLATTGGGKFPWLLVGAGAVAVWFFFFRKKNKKRAGSVVEIKSNPRRRRPAGRRAA